MQYKVVNHMEKVKFMAAFHSVVRHPTVKSSDVSELRELVFWLSYSFDIWQASQRWKSLYTNIAASRLHEILRKEVISHNK